MMEFAELIHAFRIPGKVTVYEQIPTGNINATYCVRCREADGRESRYILQRINQHVFKEPGQMMENILRVTGHIYNKMQQQNITDIERRVLHYLTTAQGNPLVEYHGEKWRAYTYVDKTHTYDKITDTAHYYHAGRAFGEFQRWLADFPADTLYETIPQFHDTPDRMRQLREAVANDAAGRAHEVQAEIDFLLSREKEAGAITEALRDDRIPWRVTHNDTKINNILFDDATDMPVCVIDMDTVMPGSSLNDYGDAIRSGSNTAGEDEADLSLVHFDLELYEQFTRGFLEMTDGYLTDAEIRMLPVGAKTLTLELCARFLTDYLNGDVYFKVKKPGHNIIRARNQIELLRQMEKNTAAMEEIVTGLRRG